MHDDITNWTHLDVKITDIRKLSEFYIFTIGKSLHDADNIMAPLRVNYKIFEERLRTYFLKDVYKITREDILGVSWNIYITKGYYIKISRGNVQDYQMDKDKYYVSYLEIAGPLGTFQSICKDRELH